MSVTYTPNLGLQKPATADRNWDVQVNGNSDAIDASALGALGVTLTEVPSSTLRVAVAAGSFRASNGLDVAYAGTGGTPLTLTGSATNYVYLDDAGTLASNTTGFLATAPTVPLATVVAGSSSITSITDSRILNRSDGYSRLAVHEGGADATMGTATLVGGTVTVSTTAVTANSRIFVTTQTLGGTIGTPYVSARVAGTSFDITSSSGTDTSTVAWLIVEPV